MTKGDSAKPDQLETTDEADQWVPQALAAGWGPTTDFMHAFFSVPGVFTITDDGGRHLVVIHPDGSLEFGEKYDPDEAARVLWDAVAAQFPSAWQSIATTAGWSPSA